VRDVPGLVALGSKHADAGLIVLFFPCNQFCAEEPGSAAEIAAFYVDRHGLPASSLMERADVNGPDTQAAYRFLRSSEAGGSGAAIEWNYSKFIVGRDGQVVGRLPQAATPEHLDEQMAKWLA
jgi:glutathione peroxidase